MRLIQLAFLFLMCLLTLKADCEATRTCGGSNCAGCGQEKKHASSLFSGVNMTFASKPLKALATVDEEVEDDQQSETKVNPKAESPGDRFQSLLSRDRTKEVEILAVDGNVDSDGLSITGIEFQNLAAKEIAYVAFKVFIEGENGETNSFNISFDSMGFKDTRFARSDRSVLSSALFLRGKERIRRITVVPGFVEFEDGVSVGMLTPSELESRDRKRADLKSAQSEIRRQLNSRSTGGDQESIRAFLGLRSSQEGSSREFFRIASDILSRKGLTSLRHFAKIDE